MAAGPVSGVEPAGGGGARGPVEAAGGAGVHMQCQRADARHRGLRSAVRAPTGKSRQEPHIMTDVVGLLMMMMIISPFGHMSCGRPLQ
jgi:hypothetical protein